MADRTRRRERPMKRAFFKPSASDSMRTHSSSGPEKPSNPSATRSNFDAEEGNEEFTPIFGTCLLMCPVKERERRERLRDLAIFERLNGDPAQSSPSLAVKKFCRTISRKDLDPSDVRPAPVLEDTLNHILKLLHSSDHSFETIHAFIFDRTRSIRQDLSMQNAVNDQVIDMYQRMVKFHIISSHYLHECSETSYAVSMIRLNQEQLIKSLITLFNLYDIVRATSSIRKDEPEFFSFFLLLQLGSDPHNTQEPLSLWLRRIPYQILKSREMQFARKLLRDYRTGNYKQFIRSAEEEASFLQYCIIEPYIDEVRVLALSCICYGGYKLQPYPLLHLSKLLIMKEDDVESLCNDCDIELTSGENGKGCYRATKWLKNVRIEPKVLFDAFRAH